MITVATIEQARAAKLHLREALGGRDGVVAIGLAPVLPEDLPGAGGPEPLPRQEQAPDGDWCVRVDVATQDTAGQVPADVDGVPVQVCVTGRITAR